MSSLEQTWTAFERRLALFVMLAEIAVLVAWVSLKALGERIGPAGLLYRSTLTAVMFGLVVRVLLRRSKHLQAAVLLAVALGLAAGSLWANVGVVWSNNLADWLQAESALALVGGPRGLVTRLTLWLALLGASLAASNAKHINIDLAARVLPAKVKAGAEVASALFAAAVCLAAAMGFVDSIAITKFQAPAFAPCDTQGVLCDTTAAQRLAVVAEGVGSDLAILGEHLKRDAQVLPRVLLGAPGEQASDHRDRLVRDLDFVLPFGLLVLGIKFILRVRTREGHA